MMIPDISRDPPRDAELAKWLRVADDNRDIGDFEQMRTALRSRARPSLMRLRTRPKWWEYAASWARPAIPAAAAAGLALAFVVNNLPFPSGADEDTAAGFPSIEEVLAARMPESDYYLVLADGTEADALLRLAVEER